MNHRTLSGMTRALFDSDLVATRLWLALAEFFCAVMLFLPGDTFDRPTYDLMGQIAPELCWAAMFLVSSVVQFQIVAFELCVTRLAHWFAGFNAALWVSSIWMMLLSVYPPPAAIGAGAALGVAAIWIWVQPIINNRGERKYGTAAKHA